MKKLYFIMTLWLVSSSGFSQPGTIDTDFGINGFVTYSGSDAFVANSSVIQGNGKIVVAGNSVGFGEAVIKRFNEDGSVDTSFNYQHTSSHSINVAFEIKLLEDSKLLVMILSADDLNSESAFLNLIKLHADGTEDSSFSTGPQTISILGEFSLFVDREGRVGVYSSADPNLDGKVEVTRYLASGILDGSFGTQGVKQVMISNHAIDSFRDFSNALIDDVEGNFYFTYIADEMSYISKTDSDFNFQFGVGRSFYGIRNSFTHEQGFYQVFGDENALGIQKHLTSTLEPDTSFGSESMAMVNTGTGNLFDWHARSAVQPDGKLLAVGLSDQKNVIVRFLEDGIPDQEFGNAGVLEYDPDLRTDQPSAVHFSPTNGRLYILNVNDSQDAPEFMFTRINLGENIIGVPTAGKENLIIYPNPVSEVVYLNKNVVEISVFDMNGKQLLHQEAPSDQLDVSQLPAGQYLLNLKTDMGQVKSKSLIKK